MNSNSSCCSFGTTGPPQLVPQNLPVGWRFHPSDEELLDYYLKRKRNGDPIEGLDIGEVQICDYDPKDLPDLSKNKSRDKVWYFFCLRLYHKNSSLAKRKAKAGYWKPTGDPRLITANGGDEEIGKKRTLVFHNPDATQWVMHEYEYTAALNSPVKGNYVLCKLKIKSNKKEKASKRLKKAEPDSKMTRPRKKARKGESDSNLTSTAASKNKKLEETTVNSAYGEGKKSNNVILDLENQDLSVAAISTCNKGETSSLMASNFENPFYTNTTVSTGTKVETSCPKSSYLENGNPNEISFSGLQNQNPYEIISLSTNNKVETSCCRYSDFEKHYPNAFEKGKLSYLVTSDFEEQNPTKILDISVSIEGDQSLLFETPSDFEYQNQYRKIDVSVQEDYQSPPMASNAGETKFQELQSQYKTNMPILGYYPGSLVASNAQEAMYQEGQSQHNTEMSIPKDNDALFTAFGVTEFPKISSHLVDKLIASFDLEDGFNSAPEQLIRGVESLNNNALVPLSI